LFDDVDPARAEMLRLGWQELELLRPKVCLAIADSKHNAECLAAVGYEDITVIAAGVDVYRLHRLTPDPAMWHRLGHEVHGPLLMYVGQSVPHKRPEVLVQMQYLLTRHVGRFPSLAMVGPPTVPVVNAAALEQARVLRVPGCLFYGQLTDAELAAVYRRADLFVTASMHEGLCIPVLEAMAAGVPVVGRSVGALPDTVGDAGLLLPADAGPEMFAEAVGELLDDEGLRNRMAYRGRQRLRDFDEAAATASFLEALAGVV
jgi:glycosyltransferase involved in cell wall biosynthesis